MAGGERSRHDRRMGLPDPVRLSHVEDDLDTMDGGLDGLNEKLGKIMWAMVGLLISVTTASVLLVLNLAVNR